MTTPVYVVLVALVLVGCGAPPPQAPLVLHIRDEAAGMSGSVYQAPTALQADGGETVDGGTQWVTPQAGAGAVEPDATVEPPPEDASTPGSDAQEPQPESDAGVGSAGTGAAGVGGQAGQGGGAGAVALADCHDVAPVDPNRMLLGGGIFDCGSAAPCTGGIQSSALFCNPTSTIGMGSFVQYRAWASANSMPKFQLKQGTCARVRAGGKCVVISRFTQDVKYTYTPMGASNIVGWIQMDVSDENIGCDLACP